MEEKTNRLLALEGLRGIAAIVVVLFHALLIFYPGFYYGLSAPFATIHNSRFEDNLYGSPFSVFLSGTFAVGIFFVLSGFVLTIGFFQTGNETIIKKLAAKRYIRLMIPALTSILVVWVILSIGLGVLKMSASDITSSHWLANIWQFTPNLFDALTQGLWGIFAKANVSYNPVLWTMQYELIGSIVVFALALIFKQSRHRWLIYTAAFIGTFHTWYVAFIIGMILADLYASKKFPFAFVNNKVMFAALLLGLLFGGYPAITSQGSFYQTMHISWLTEAQNQSFYLSIGAGLVITAILSIPLLSRFFSSKHISKLGKYTYSLYLSHMAVLFTVCTGLFVWLHSFIGFNKAALISIVLTAPVVIIVAYIFERYVDAPAIRLSGVFANWFLGLPQKQGASAMSVVSRYAFLHNVKSWINRLIVKFKPERH